MIEVSSCLELKLEVVKNIKKKKETESLLNLKLKPKPET